MNSEILSALVTLIVGVVGAALTYAGIKATNKAQAEAAEPANWQTLTSEMKTFFKEQLAERDQRLAALESENGLRGDYIAHLETCLLYTSPSPRDRG